MLVQIGRKCWPSLLLWAINVLCAPSYAHVDISRVNKDALVKVPEIVECKLTNGATTQCAKLVVKHQPDHLQTGPFCPDDLSAPGGIWQWDGEQSGLYSINAEFLTMLNALGYSFYDEQGKVNISDPRKVRPGDGNYCLMASVDESVEMTVLLPLHPRKAEQPTALGTVAKVGLALDGVPVFSDAPSVLQTGQMPALDPCGGHVDPGGWYHWHATATDINTVFSQHEVDAKCALAQHADAMFAYAFDGFAIYGSIEADGSIPTELDKCHGHVGPTAEHPEGIYHYHATVEFPNLPACLSGIQAKQNFTTTAEAGIGSQRQRRPNGMGPGQRERRNNGPVGHRGMPPGFDTAAQKLGLSAVTLFNAIQENGGPNADLNAVADLLGVTVQNLKQALPPRPQHQRRPRPPR